MSKPSDDIQRELYSFMGQYIPSEKVRWRVLDDLETIMESPGAAELVRLMQKWLASV